MLTRYVNVKPFAARRRDATRCGWSFLCALFRVGSPSVTPSHLAESRSCKAEAAANPERIESAFEGSFDFVSRPHAFQVANKLVHV